MLRELTCSLSPEQIQALKTERRGLREQQLLNTRKEHPDVRLDARLTARVAQLNREIMKAEDQLLAEANGL